LALEAHGVIGLRAVTIARGGVDAVLELDLMVREKFDAAAEAMRQR
jgi:hypothetical protein